MTNCETMIFTMKILLQTLKERKAKAKISQLPIRTLEAGELLGECTICLEDITFPGVKSRY